MSVDVKEGGPGPDHCREGDQKIRWRPTTSLQQPLFFLGDTAVFDFPTTKEIGERCRDEYRQTLSQWDQEGTSNQNSRDRKAPSKFWVWPWSSVYSVGGGGATKSSRRGPRATLPPGAAVGPSPGIFPAHD